IPLLAALAVVALTATVLAGCAGAATPAAIEAPDASGSPTASGAVTVVNCGVEVSFERAPERVVTILSSTTEAMLALGLGDRIVASAYQNSPVVPQWAKVQGSIPVIADRVPGQEAVLALEPDLI